MTSPARRHFLRQSAIEAARQETGPTAHANGYELMLLKLYEDKRRLKQVRSQERKADLKRQLLPEYARGWPVFWRKGAARRTSF